MRGQQQHSYDCYSTSGVWRTIAQISGEQNGSSSIGGGCLSSYSWNSGGYNHLCNDDSAYELWQVKNGSTGHGWLVDTNGNGYELRLQRARHRWRRRLGQLRLHVRVQQRLQQRLVAPDLPVS